MSENYWWSHYGPFKPWRECPTRPDPGEVLLFYLEKSGIGPEEQVTYLMDLLDLQKSMVYTILKGDGLDTISRCRVLVDALKIYPPLLGLDAKYFPIERHAYWWQNCGYPFDADAQGYPLIGQVIAFFRVHRMQEGGGSVKAWSQDDLGDATGLRKETIYRMEHDRNPLILEHMRRRAIVATALGTLAGEQEPTLFRLFGLDPQAYGVPVHVQDTIPEVHLFPECLTDEILDEYQRKLETFFTAFYTGHAQDLVENAYEWLRQVEALQSLAETSAQRVTLFALECRYHELLAAILRERMRDNRFFAHTTRAVELAEQALTLPDPQLGEQELLTRTNELVAAALLWRADTLFEFNEFLQAQPDIDRALSLLPALQSKQLKVRIVAEAGLIHAYTATDEMDRALVLSYFNLAGQLNASGRCQQVSHALDEHFIHADRDLLCLYKAMALSAPHMRGTTAYVVSDLLETAQKVTPPELLRQHTSIAVFHALNYFAGGDYQQAIEAAIDALKKSRVIRSRLKRERIEDLYEHLLDTHVRDQPRLSYLGMKLRTWAYGMS